MDLNYYALLCHWLLTAIHSGGVRPGFNRSFSTAEWPPSQINYDNYVQAIKPLNNSYKVILLLWEWTMSEVDTCQLKIAYHFSWPILKDAWTIGRVCDILCINRCLKWLSSALNKTVTRIVPALLQFSLTVNWFLEPHENSVRCSNFICTAVFDWNEGKNCSLKEYTAKILPLHYASCNYDFFLFKMLYFAKARRRPAKPNLPNLQNTYHSYR